MAALGKQQKKLPVDTIFYSFTTHELMECTLAYVSVLFLRTLICNHISFLKCTLVLCQCE
jgi:hypothetical protein